MKTCTNCGALLKDDAMFCTQCGAAAQAAAPAPEQQYSNEGLDQAYNGNQQYQQYQQPPVQYISPYDHTAEYDPEDISKGKPYCMLVYLCGIIGIIIALLASSAEKSPYINFHVRQQIKFCVIQILSTIVMAILAITIVIPIAGAIWLVILLVLRIIAFFQVCMGKAKEPAIIRAFPFLK